MKKTISAIACTIFAIPAVKAQEITILGKTFSLIIIIPLTLIILSLLLFCTLQIQKNIKKVKAILNKILLALLRVQRVLAQTRIGAAYKKIKSFKIKKPKPKPAEVTEKKPVIEKEEIDYVTEMEHIEKNIQKTKIEESFEKFSKLTRHFFSEMLNLDYQFTYYELTKELQKKKRKELINFVDKLSTFRYSKGKISHQDLKQLIKKFKPILEQRVKKKKVKLAPKTILGKLIEEDKRILEGVKGYVESVKKEDRERQLKRLLIDEKALLSRDLREVKKAHQKVLSMYCKLSLKERNRLYPGLIKFCEYIKVHPSSTEQSREQLQEFINKIRALKEIPLKKSFTDKISEILDNLGRKLKKKAQTIEEPKFIKEVKKAVLKEEKVIAKEITTALEKLHEEEKELAEKIKIGVEKSKIIQPTIKAVKSGEKEIKKLLIKGEEDIAKGSVLLATEVYDGIKLLYKDLSLFEKKKVHPLITQFYNTLMMQHKKERRKPKTSEKLRQLTNEEDKINEKQRLIEISKLMRKAEAYLKKKNLPKATKTYKQIRELYKELNKENKEKLGPEILNLHKKISAKIS